MSVNFTLTSKTRVDQFRDSASLGDVISYSIDCTPWQEDNATITGVTFTALSGAAVSITSPLVASGVVSAILNFTQAGRSLVSILLTTASGLTKKIWLEINVKDVQLPADDYGLNNNN
jgi:deoxyhypusine synthase